MPPIAAARNLPKICSTTWNSVQVITVRRSQVVLLQLMENSLGLNYKSRKQILLAPCYIAVGFWFTPYINVISIF
uniref:Uncharacterized protein n=1 Tax=Anguilla anguilla TaxID=7936 RepID=A0A0E9WXE9_ANGAN